ncbi:MAG: glycosyltransferase [Oligoflexia bacterium]|nr:glycosyltransferase [Oligoflexia bacterium]
MSEHPPQASLLVTTYELPRHLELVCAALERQSTHDFEVIFCDDGSGAETAGIIRAFQSKVPFRVKHVWQEHQGFRKCRILNEGLRQARAPVFIFLDGDCIPHRDYLRDHLEQQEPGRYLAGRRVELGERFSEWLTPERVRAGFFDRPRLRFLKSVLSGDSGYFQRTIRFSWEPLRRALKMDRVADLKGCNYSVPRSALEALNGFDEAYEGYGREDTDIELRLQNLGLRIKSMKGLALQYHVWHPRREFTPANDARLQELKSSGRVRCEKGWQTVPG